MQKTNKMQKSYNDFILIADIGIILWAGVLPKCSFAYGRQMSWTGPAQVQGRLESVKFPFYVISADCCQSRDLS